MAAMTFINPAQAVYINLFSLGMIFILVGILEIPGPGAKTGKLFWGAIVFSYILTMLLDLYLLHYSPASSEQLTVIGKLFGPSFFWNGPFILWMGKSISGLKVFSRRSIALFLALWILLKLSNFLLPGLMSVNFYNEMDLSKLFSLTFIFAHGLFTASLVRRKGLYHKKIVYILIALILFFSGTWGILSSLENSELGFSLAIVLIPLILLLTQGCAFIVTKHINGKKTKRASIDKIGQYYTLTLRESEVLREVICGKSNKEIGFQLNISENTVKRHMNSLFRKCNVSSRFELVVLVGNSD